MAKNYYKKYIVTELPSPDLRFAVLRICIAFCILFALTLFIDIQVKHGLLTLPNWFSIGDIDDARTVLSAIIGAVSTVLGLVFSVVLLVLSVAGSQFGPRLLRLFILDQKGETTIGLFSATFLFSLFTMVVMRSNNNYEFVPHLTTFTAAILMIVSFASLITFSQRIRTGIQTGNLIARVTADLSGSLANYIALRKYKNERMISSSEDPLVLRQNCYDLGYPILAVQAGYLQAINYGKIIAEAAKANVVVAMKVHPGNFVIKGTVIAYILPAQENLSFIRCINSALFIGPNRSLTQDPEFAFSQIVEVGARALSPAVNDPFTAIACIDWLANNILSLSELPETGDAWLDEKGQIRLLELDIKFPRLVRAAFDMIREAAAKDPSVLIRLLQNFSRIGPHFKNNEHRAALMRQVRATKELIDLQSFTDCDLEDMQAFYIKASEALQPLHYHPHESGSPS